MAEMIWQGRTVYYEVHGEGFPLMILNGIMMSHLSYLVFLKELSRNQQVILVDFLDQGKSDKMETSYKHELQVELIEALTKTLEINQMNLFGISYGGEIALQYALAHPEKLKRLLVFNAAAYTSAWLHDIGRAWIAAAKTLDPMTFYHVSIPYIYSSQFYNQNEEWMKNRKQLLLGVFTKPFLNAMIRLIESSEGYDIRTSLKNITIPTLIVGAECDYITPIEETQYLHIAIPGSHYIVLKGCGHASMYEKPNEFVSLINGFVGLSERMNII